MSAESIMTVDIDMTNLAKVRHELDLFAPDLKKELDKRLSKVGKNIVDSAKARTPSVTGRTRASYKVKRRTRGDDVIVSAYGSSASSAIREFAAIGHSNQGASLVATLNARYGRPGRFLWQAYDNQSPPVPSQIEDAIKDVSREFETRIKRF